MGDGGMQYGNGGYNDPRFLNQQYPGQPPYPVQPQYGQPQFGQPQQIQPYNPYAAAPYSNAPGPYSAMPMMSPGAPFGVDPLTGIPYSDKSKTTAGLLQLFLGGFGVGRFYLGHAGIGVAQLLLWIVGIATSWLGVGLVLLFGVWIWALIDAIMIFTGSVRDSDGRVLR